MCKYPPLRKNADQIDKLLLQCALNKSILSTNETLEHIIMTTREELLNSHQEKHSIWQNKTTKKWCTKIGGEKRLVVRKERSDLETAILDFYLTMEKESATFDYVFNLLCKNMKDTKSHAMKTINEYQYDYNRMIGNTNFSKLPINQIKEKDIIHFLKELTNSTEKLPRKRFSSAKTIIRNVFNFARLELDIETISVKNILADLNFPPSVFKDSSTEDNTQCFKISEINRIKDLFKNTEDLKELGILLAIETGTRLGELCTLKRCDVTDSELHIVRSEHKAKFDEHFKYFIDPPKKNKNRIIVLSNDAKKVLKRILSLHSSDWLFPSSDNNEWIKSYHFDKIIRQTCKKLSIPVRSLHKIRKTYSSYLFMNGIPDKMIQLQLGHADIATTHKFYYYDITDNNEKVNLLQDIHFS